MKTHKIGLMPFRCQVIGWWLLISDFVLFSAGMVVIHQSETLHQQGAHILGSICGALLCVGLVMIGLSKEKYEDEWIMHLRTKAVVITGTLLFILFIAATLLSCLDMAMGHPETNNFGPFIETCYRATNILPAFVLYIVLYKVFLFTSSRESRNDNQ